MIDSSVLIGCLENYMFLASRGGGLRRLSYPGVRGHVSGLAQPLTNLVGAAGSSEAIPERSVDEVFAEFGRLRLPFLWLVGPHGPEGMGARLRRRGMSPFQQLSGLATSDLDLPRVSAARLHEVRPDERDRFGAVLLDSFELEGPVLDFLARYYFFASTLRSRNYLAFVDDHPEPAGVASSVYDPESRVAVLAIAAVKQQFRGRGIYRDLVQRRLADAKADGCVAAVVHAQSTNLRGCLRLGFREICQQRLLSLDQPA
ncbi:MAG TPA: GNAT family N-acetyltransferase [Polyangiaceae bacterium]